MGTFQPSVEHICLHQLCPHIFEVEGDFCFEGGICIQPWGVPFSWHGVWCVLVGTSSVEVIHFRRLEGVVAGSVPADWGGGGVCLLTGVGECPC